MEKATFTVSYDYSLVSSGREESSMRFNKAMSLASEAAELFKSEDPSLKVEKYITVGNSVMISMRIVKHGRKNAITETSPSMIKEIKKIKAFITSKLGNEEHFVF